MANRWLRLALTLALAVLALLAWPWIPASAEGNHIRVVLDTSLSMLKGPRGSPGNDPGRLAVLATALLYDLVDPNPRLVNRSDSFEVYPFDRWEEWTDTAAPPRVKQPEAAIVAWSQTPQGRSEFMQALDKVAYKAPFTYFHPGLRRALDSLKAQQGPPEDTHVIVLVTDGVPEEKTRAAEGALLGTLREEARAAGVRLYILGFGPAAVANRGFLEGLVQVPAGRDLGRLFVDPDGGRLMATMLDIFSLSFGYAVDKPLVVADLPPQGLDLDAGATPTKVALATLATGPSPPSQTLTPSPNSPAGVVTATQPGASYSLQWILGPRPGPYAFASNDPGATLAVLRPVAPLLGVRPGRVPPPGGSGQPREMRQALRVMAGVRFSLRLLVSSPAGTAGNQPDVHLSFRTQGPRTGPCAYAWNNSEEMSPAVGSAQRTPDGVSHEIWMAFAENPRDPDQPYPGFVEVEARSGGKVVAALRCAEAHALAIFPRLSLTPQPAEGLLGPAPLAPRAIDRCVDFNLTAARPERLGAVLGASPYGLKASLSARGDPGILDAELAGARWRLDGKPIEFLERPADQPGPWTQGQALQPDELLGPHRLCLDLGRPRIAATREGLGIDLALRLIHPAYEDFDVVGPFTARLSVLAPGLTPIAWSALVPLGATPLVMAIGLWLWQGRRALAPDLRYALWQGEAATGLATALPARNPWAWLTGGAPRRAILDPLSQETLAWVLPLDRGLFALVLPPEVEIGAADGGEPPVCGEGRYRVQARRLYRLTRGADDWRLRFDYRAS